MADRAPPQPAVRRSATLPTRLHTPISPRGPAGAMTTGPHASATPQPETLFVCPVAKIFSFPESLSRPTTASSPGAGQESGTLPWASPTERAAAVGPLRLYRLPGSVSFLSSGELLLSLMPRSQCWCVDGVAKFAMKIKSYIYRVELPHETDRDRATVEEFKQVLARIIQYEKTACPFKRSFTVDLPDDAPSPVRSAKPRGPVSKARKWVTDEGWRPEDVDPDEWRARYLRERSPGGLDEDRASATADGSGTTRRTSPLPAPLDDVDSGPAVRPLHPDSYRNFTAPTKYSFTDADPFRAAQARADASAVAPMPIAGGAGSGVGAGAGMPMGRSRPEPGRVGRMVARHASLQSPVLNAPIFEDEPVEETPQVNGQGVEDDIREDEPTTTTIPDFDEGRDTPVPPAVLEEPAHTLDDLRSTTPVIAEQKSVMVEAERPVLVQTEVPVADSTSDVRHRQQSLNSMTSVQSFHTTRTGLSPKPSFASFKPTLETIEHDETERQEPTAVVEPAYTPALETIEHDEAEAMEPTIVVEPAHTPPSIQTKGTVSYDSPPAASPVPTPTSAPHFRKGHAMRHKDSMSLLAAAARREVRRQPSMSFNPSTESQDFATSLISTAAALLMGPPSGLLAAMVQIATRMARGAFGPGSAAFRYREGRWKRDGARWMPGGWESDDEEYWEEERAEGDEGEWDQKTLAGDEDDEKGVVSETTSSAQEEAS